jgi:hypothetical protein
MYVSAAASICSAEGGAYTGCIIDGSPSIQQKCHHLLESHISSQVQRGRTILQQQQQSPTGGWSGFTLSVGIWGAAALHKLHCGTGKSHVLLQRSGMTHDIPEH